MTYSRSLQGRFVSGRYTPLILLLVSVVVWRIGALLLPASAGMLWPVYMFSVSGGMFSSIVPLFCYIAVAVILGMLHLHERRISWFTSLYFFLSAASLFIHNDVVSAVSAVLFIALMAALMACQPGDDAEGALFAAFSLLGLLSFLLPQFLFLLPLFVAYLLIANISGLKRFLAAMLGLILPFWFLFGITYAWPEVAESIPAIDRVSGCLAFPAVIEFTPLRLLLLVAELGVMLPAMMVFATSSVPSKPLLRRRLLFMLVANSYLLLLSIFSAPNFDMLYAWRVPGTAVFASYLFSLKVTRYSNIYFVLFFIFWLAIAVFSVWAN